jgi:hypothetical protein
MVRRPAQATAVSAEGSHANENTQCPAKIPARYFHRRSRKRSQPNLLPRQLFPNHAASTGAFLKFSRQGFDRWDLSIRPQIRILFAEVPTLAENIFVPKQTLHFP